MGIQTNDIPQEFKMTEFGTLPQEWDVVRLGDAVSVYDKQRIPLRSEDRQGMQGGFPYCGANGIIDHINQYIFDGEFVLLAEDGGYWHSFEESSYVMNGKFWVNNHAHILAAIDGKAANYYLMYALNYLDISVFIGGTTRGKLTQGVMKAIPIPLPPLPEQKAIARVLSTIQKAVETQDKIIAAARELKKSLMRHLFTYGPVSVAEAEKVPLKETEIGPVPEHWEVVRLGEATEKPEYGYTATASFEKVGPKFLRITDIQNGQVSWSSVPYCQYASNDVNKYLLRTGDILFARIGATTGKTFMMEDSQPAIFASYLIRVRCKSALQPMYLNQFTSTHAYWKQINASKGGRLKQGVNIPVLKSLLIPLAPIPEQQEIASMLSAVDNKIESEENRKSALQALFKTMLHHLMTGKVRV